MSTNVINRSPRKGPKQAGSRAAAGFTLIEILIVVVTVSYTHLTLPTKRIV